MDQDRSGEEGLLEQVEGFSGRWSPGQRLGYEILRSVSGLSMEVERTGRALESE